MAKIVKWFKLKESTSIKVFFFVFVTFAVLAIVLLLTVKRSTPIHNNTPATPTAITPKLEMISYTLKPTNNETLLISSNYDFQVVFPTGYEITTERHFTKYYPENETVSIGAVRQLDSLDKDNFMSYSLSIGFLNNLSIEKLTNKQVEGIKRSLVQAGKAENDGQIQTQTVTTQTGKFAKIRHIDAFNFESISYYISYKDEYYHIIVGQSRNTRFSQTQLNEIDQVINSFRFTN